MEGAAPSAPCSRSFTAFSACREHGADGAAPSIGASLGGDRLSHRPASHLQAKANQLGQRFDAGLVT